MPALAALTDKFNEALPRMAPFVAEMAGAVSRTSVLGTAYPKYSAAYSAAMQAILIGRRPRRRRSMKPRKPPLGVGLSCRHRCRN